ncbi:MAG: hypothetical protein ACLFQO_21425 [Cyclobacteriaceae bacterium]
MELLFIKKGYMSKYIAKPENSKTNPFLTDKADLLWESLDKNGKAVSKEDILKRIKDIKNNPPK